MKKIVRIGIGFLLASMVARAQNPQTQTAPIIPENAKYINGVAPGYYPTAGGGLTLNVGPGTANCAGTMITYAGGTLSLTASTTNYIYLNTASSCAPATKTSVFSASDIPLAKVITGSASITSIVDDRTPFFESQGINATPYAVDITQPPYSAKCDGSTVDNAAFQLAANTPAFTYYVPSTVSSFCNLTSTITIPRAFVLTGGTLGMSGSGTQFSSTNSDAVIQFNSVAFLRGSNALTSVISISQTSCTQGDASDLYLNDGVFVSYGTSEYQIVNATNCVYVIGNNVWTDGDIYGQASIFSFNNTTLGQNVGAQPAHIIEDSMISSVFNGLSNYDRSGTTPAYSSGSVISLTNSLDANSGTYHFNSVNLQNVNSGATVYSLGSYFGSLDGATTWSGTGSFLDSGNVLSGSMMQSTLFYNPPFHEMMYPFFSAPDTNTSGPQSIPGALVGALSNYDAGFGAVSVQEIWMGQMPSSTSFSTAIDYQPYVPGTTPIVGNDSLLFATEGSIENSGVVDEEDFGVADYNSGADSLQVVTSGMSAGNVGIGGTSMEGGGDADNGDLFVDAGVGAVEKYSYAAPTFIANSGTTVMDRCSGGSNDGVYVAAASTQATACTVGGGSLVNTGIKTP